MWKFYRRGKYIETISDMELDNSLSRHRLLSGEGTIRFDEMDGYRGTYYIGNVIKYVSCD